MYVHLEKELDWVLDMVQSLLLPIWKLWNIPRNQAEHFNITYIMGLNHFMLLYLDR
jgi:hypothetical protein